MKKSDKFTFGKFKGQTLAYVMANKGSYVGWCLENIKGFHIEPESLETEFLKGYNKWKKDGCKGLTVDYREHSLQFGVKEMEIDMINKLDSFQDCDIDETY